MKKVLVILMVCMLFPGCAFFKRSEKSWQRQTIASRTDSDLVEIYSEEMDYTGKQLRELAVNRGIIPAEADYTYFQKNSKEQNAAAIWLVYSRQEKIAAIDSYKRIFKLRGAIIGKPSDYYVDRINGVFFLRIQRNDFDTAKNKGIVNILKTIAVLEGDYDDGRNKAVILRQWIGEDNFQIFKKEYPEEYKRLLEM